MSTVVEKILEKCRGAMLGGIPLLYIKTDSDFLIREILTDETAPLVHLISSKTGEGGARYAMRPLSEKYGVGHRCRLKDAFNYSDTLPGSYTSITYPHIWAYRMPSAENATDYQNTVKVLTEFVRNHEDPHFESYDMLRYSAVLLYSGEGALPPSLMPYTEFIDVDLPDEEEIRSVILSEARDADYNIASNEEFLSVLCTHFLGFTKDEIILTMQKILALHALADDGIALKIILDKKKQKMAGGILEYCKTDANIGGMEDYVEWLNRQIDPLKYSNIYRRTVGTPPPKGVLLCGIPGCGKSEAAKYTAARLGLPLLRMDMGSLMNKFVGASEERMRDALRLAEAMSPCVLWIDELEKAFSGASGGDGDSGGFKRMFAYMLGWMQDNEKPCFLFATANDIGVLPKEFFRSGRFDALYAVYLPTCSECASILAACMKKAEQTYEKANRKDSESPNKPLPLFSEACYEEDKLRAFIIENFSDRHGEATPVIGSDLKKTVDAALRSLMEKAKASSTVIETISDTDWFGALKEVAASPSMQVYGDSYENVESIALSYCRLLRKGFLPTGQHVLFRTEDYRVQNYRTLAQLKAKAARQATEEERNACEEEMKKVSILSVKTPWKKDRVLDNKYDQAIYKRLCERINDLAMTVEEVERNKMIGR